jgi:hypothetical protein
MTPTNLGICIGCSLLYPKEQLSNSYTNCSSIIELMIVYHKQFFPPDNQSDRTSLVNKFLFEKDKINFIFREIQKKVFSIWTHLNR